MLMPKRVKRRKQFRGSMKVKLLEETRLQTVNMVSLQWNHAGSSSTRSKQPVLL
jgi:hypothetical protein